MDTTFDGSVTLALANNPAGGTLGGTLTATAVNGVADFPGLTINNPGNGYTLQATTNGLTSATTDRHRRNAPRSGHPAGGDHAAAGQRHRRQRLRPGRHG